MFTAGPDSPPGRARVVTDRPRMELSVFPHDPDLPSLPLAITASVMGPQIAQLSSTLTPIQRAERSHGAASGSVALLQPGKRATVRLGTPVSEASLWPRSTMTLPRRRPSRTKRKHLAGSPVRRPPSGANRWSPSRDLSRGAAIDPRATRSTLCYGRRLDGRLPQGGAGAASALAQLHRGRRQHAHASGGKELHRFRARALRICAVDSQVGIGCWAWLSACSRPSIVPGQPAGSRTRRL